MMSAVKRSKMNRYSFVAGFAAVWGNLRFGIRHRRAKNTINQPVAVSGSLAETRGGWGA